MRERDLTCLSPSRPLRQAMLASVALSVLAAGPVLAQATADEQLYLGADALVGQNGRYVATGEVEMRYNDRTLRAGEVDYDYKVTLSQAVKHADVGNNENTDILSGITFQVTDSDSDKATGTFDVTVVDDVPTAK